ncbi:DUF6445 family protein [Rheinheimera sp.]|uniref:DUF6445 family protein n=1 Tax=Rheinheimera sp. TaxID=1869214 RepID=UPI00307FAD88
MKCQAMRFGQEQQPLLLVDDFVPEPDSLIDYALTQQDVQQAAGLYPGLRSAAPPGFAQWMQQRLAPVLQPVFGLQASQLVQLNCFYSLVTTAADQLSLPQRLPHFDRPEQQELAAVLYLCGAEHGGTSFYRQRSTGYEYVDQSRLAQYQQQQRLDLQQYGEPQGYICGDTALYQRVLQIPARKNRLLLYRCSSLHSGDISADYRYDENPWTGRFTLTAFWS